MSKSGQEWTLPAQQGQLKTGQDGEGLLQIHLWCPDDLPRLWDRIENRDDKTKPTVFVLSLCEKYRWGLISSGQYIYTLLGNLFYRATVSLPWSCTPMYTKEFTFFYFKFTFRVRDWELSERISPLDHPPPTPGKMAIGRTTILLIIRTS